VEEVFFGKARTLIILIVILHSTLTFASDGEIVKFQGKVMGLDLKKSMMIVNEKNIVWNEKTFIGNQEGSSIRADRLKVKIWLYIVGTKDVAQNRILASKIYLIPKQIDGKERHLYPFMEE
jgi:hypothetical protein